MDAVATSSPFWTRAQASRADHLAQSERAGRQPLDEHDVDFEDPRSLKQIEGDRATALASTVGIREWLSTARSAAAESTAATGSCHAFSQLRQSASSRENDNEPRRGRPVPWLGIASLLVTVARLLVELWRKG